MDLFNSIQKGIDRFNYSKIKNFCCVQGTTDKVNRGW